MGTTYSSQKTYKICLECTQHNPTYRNDNIEILNVFYGNINDPIATDTFLLRCDRGHIFYYSVPSSSRQHTEAVRNYLSPKNAKDKLIIENKKLVEQNDKLVEQNNKLKKILEENSIDYDNNGKTEPSAPILEQNLENVIQIVEVEAYLINDENK
jgi:hypothetical protein